MAGRTPKSSIGAFQAKTPGHTFRLASEIEQHHDQLRFAWEMLSPEGSVALGDVKTLFQALEGRRV